jgi:hypothetical protein
MRATEAEIWSLLLSECKNPHAPARGKKIENYFTKIGAFLTL